MGAVDNRSVGPGLLDERNETWHLRVVDEDDICATSSLGKHIGITKTRDEMRRSSQEDHLQKASNAQRCR